MVLHDQGFLLQSELCIFKPTAMHTGHKIRRRVRLQFR